MNGIRPKIEIFAPFGVAYEWMKSMLFRPFDAGRWFVIAFAAFLSGAMGGGLNPGQIGRLGNGDWRYRSESHGDFSNWNVAPWIIGMVVGLVVIALVLSVVWMWVSARGKFIFTDGIVKNCAAIGEPWREYRREGNSFFLFSLAIAACALLIIAILVLLLWFCFSGMRGDHSGPGMVIVVIGIIVMALIWIAFALFFGVVSAFMVPVMYRRRCSAKEAFLDVTKLIFANPGPFVLIVLFWIVLAIGVAMIGTIVTCLTCCIGGLPYINTVLLLPALVWLAAFKLLFLRQFGDPYDVWATVEVPQSADSPAQPPPTEALPPPPPPEIP